MNNLSHGKGEKGSKFWMRSVMEIPDLEKEINAKIGQDVRWIFPKADDNYREYAIKSRQKELELTPDKIKKIFSFWPLRQPQWDGMAIGGEGNKKVLYLAEAKAHRRELCSRCRAVSGHNIINETMYKVYKDNYQAGDFSCWINSYYQMANRLTFYHKLRDMISSNDISVFSDIKLVYLYFVNDFTNILTSEELWKEYMENVFEKMTGKREAPTGLLEVMVDVKKYSYLVDKGQDGSWFLKDNVNL